MEKPTNTTTSFRSDLSRVLLNIQNLYIEIGELVYERELMYKRLNEIDPLVERNVEIIKQLEGTAEVLNKYRIEDLEKNSDEKLESSE